MNEEEKKTFKLPGWKRIHWMKMTGENQHTEARIEIAEFFGMDTLKNVFKGIEQIELAEGYAPACLLEYKSAKTCQMMDAIAKEYSEELAKRVYDCL